MRWLLILVLIQGLAPGIGELVETVVHRINTGHFAHVAGDPHHDEQSATEHGCSATAHRCQCCATLPAVARARFSMELPTTTAAQPECARGERRPDGVASTVFRPPIV